MLGSSLDRRRSRRRRAKSEQAMFQLDPVPDGSCVPNRFRKQTPHGRRSLTRSFFSLVGGVEEKQRESAATVHYHGNASNRIIGIIVGHRHHLAFIVYSSVSLYTAVIETVRLYQYYFNIRRNDF